MRRKHSAATRAQYFYGNREIFLCAVIKIDLSISPIHEVDYRASCVNCLTNYLGVRTNPTAAVNGGRV